MELYKIFLNQNGAKEALKEIDSDTLAILKSFNQGNDYFQIDNDQTLNLATNLEKLMRQKKEAGLVSSDVELNFNEYMMCVDYNKNKTL